MPRGFSFAPPAYDSGPRTVERRSRFAGNGLGAKADLEIPWFVKNQKEYKGFHLWQKHRTTISQFRPMASALRSKMESLSFPTGRSSPLSKATARAVIFGR